MLTVDCACCLSQPSCKDSLCNSFGRASLSTYSTAALLSVSYMTGKLARPLALMFLLVEVLQMAGSLLKPGA